MKDKSIIFTTAWLQVSCVAANTVFIAHDMMLAMLITGFLISLIWTLNVKKIAFGSWSDRFVYSFGAMTGTGTGYIIANAFTKLIC